MKFLRLWPLLLVVACEPVMTADVTRFNSLPEVSTGQTFAIQPQKDQAGSPEFQRDANLVAAALEVHGFRPTPAEGASADVVVRMRSGPAGSRIERQLADWDGGIYRGPGFWGTGYGWWPDYEQTVVTGKITRQMLEVELLDGRTWRAGERRVLFQGRAIGESEVSDINATMPALVRGLFSGFPGSDGQTIRLTIPVANR